MNKYGQYCPVAMATELLGDKWTLLIVRDLLTGTSHFNDLERGLPGISRGLLANRLRRLEAVGVLEKEDLGRGRKTKYRLTQAGQDLQDVIQAMLMWGARWAFDTPSKEQLDPLLLLWWMRDRVNLTAIPRERLVIQFDFQHKKQETYWLLLKPNDVSICLTYPGFETDVLVTTPLTTFFQLWMGRIEYSEALAEHGMTVEAIPALVRAFPTWFAWSLAAPAIRAVRAEKGYA